MSSAASGKENMEEDCDIFFPHFFFFGEAVVHGLLMSSPFLPSQVYTSPSTFSADWSWKMAAPVRSTIQPWMSTESNCTSGRKRANTGCWPICGSPWRKSISDTGISRGRCRFTLASRRSFAWTSPQIRLVVWKEVLNNLSWFEGRGGGGGEASWASWWPVVSVNLLFCYKIPLIWYLLLNWSSLHECVPHFQWPGITCIIEIVRRCHAVGDVLTELFCWRVFRTVHVRSTLKLRTELNFTSGKNRPLDYWYVKWMVNTVRRTKKIWSTNLIEECLTPRKSSNQSVACTCCWCA